MGDYYETCPYRLGAVLLIALLIITDPSWIAIPTDARAAAGLSKTQLLRLKKGEILVNVRQKGDLPRGMVEAVILIEAPAENIWRIMTDCREIPTFVPGLEACRVLDSGQNWEIIRHQVKWIWFLPKFVYVFRADYKPNRKIDFVRIQGDLREMKGTWRLTPLDRDNQTLVSYSVFLDPGFFVPQWLVRRSLKADLPAVLTSLRTKVLNSRPRP
jgi:ribosome-associated toxin RatA of RatAB toxin-antitoxin module